MSRLCFGCALVALAACGNHTSGASLSPDGGATDDGSDANHDAAGDRIAVTDGDPVPADRGEVRVGFACRDLCRSPFLLACPGRRGPETCVPACEYDRASNGGCFEFDALAWCLADAPANPFECTTEGARARADVCVPEKQAFCANPRCFAAPPGVAGCPR